MVIYMFNGPQTNKLFDSWVYSINMNDNIYIKPLYLSMKDMRV